MERITTMEFSTFPDPSEHAGHRFRSSTTADDILRFLKDDKAMTFTGQGSKIRRKMRIVYRQLESRGNRCELFFSDNGITVLLVTAVSVAHMFRPPIGST